jgi:hypothetical protein
MTGDGHSVERLRGYLQTEARVMVIAEFGAACCAAMPLPRANDFVLKELLRSIRVLCRTLFGSDYVGLLAKAAKTAVQALGAPSASRSGG